MWLLEPVLRVAGKLLGSVTSERLQRKLDHFDERLDVLERDGAVMREQIKSLHEISVANLEAVEQKVNATNVSIQALDLIVKHHLSYMDNALERITQTVKDLVCK